jgi:hypothetical protein
VVGGPADQDRVRRPQIRGHLIGSQVADFAPEYGPFAAAADSSDNSLAALARLLGDGELWLLEREQVVLPLGVAVVRSAECLHRDGGPEPKHPGTTAPLDTWARGPFRGKEKRPQEARPEAAMATMTVGTLMARNSSEAADFQNTWCKADTEAQE